MVELRPCRACGKTFAQPAGTHHPVYTCSRKCANASRSQNAKNGMFRRAESTKQDRVRANGLVNMRIRRGRAQRPSTCEQCGKTCRPDAHHDDYSQPDQVRYLCRSCHMRHHYSGSVQ